MKNIIIVRKKILLSFVAAFFLAVISFAIYSFIRANISFGELEGWDGVTVTEFTKGNGSVDNPYLIEDASQFMYFKNAIEGDNSKTYEGLYFSLENDIDFNGKAITPIGVVVDDVERIFKGHFNGNGHKLTNFKINEATVIGDESYYSLFTKVENASFSSLEVANYTINCKESDNIVVSPFIGKNIDIIDENVSDKTSNYYGVYLHDFYIDLSKINTEVEISPFIKEANNVGIKKLIVVGEYNTNDSIVLSPFPAANFVINGIHLLNSDLEFGHDLVSDYYLLKNGEFYHDGEVVSNELLLSLLNDENKGDNYWDLEDGNLVVKEYEKVEEVPDSAKQFSFSIKRSAAIGLHDSGVEGTTVYVNDIDSDYNHYMGLNYTQSNTGVIGNGTNQNFYSPSNLVQVYMQYVGHPIDDDTITGRVSLTENYTDFIYYKYYPITNGTIKIPLIDNPYAVRPTDLAFNGWVTDYDGAVVSFDVETYTRYVTIPASTGPISITMYASWTEATAVTATVNNYVLDTTYLKEAKMSPIVRITPIYPPNVNIPTLYLQYTINSGTSYWGGGVNYPNGAVDQNGNSLAYSTCSPSGSWWSGYTARDCPYFLSVDPDSIDYSVQYYYLPRYGSMTYYTFPTPIDYEYDSIFEVGQNVSGFYRKVSLTNNQSYAGYYNELGAYQNSGTCSGNCTYYELLQYSDENVITEANFSSFYYLVTRDTNIAFVDNNINGFSNNKPVTVTGIHNGTNRTTRYIYLDDRSVQAYADLRIEQVQLYSNQYSTDTNGPSYSNTNYVYGNFNNLKIGRGLTIRTGGNGNNRRNYYNARGVIAGSDSGVGSAANPAKYHMIVESGYYNFTSGIGTRNASGNFYTNGYTTFGCDLDRINTDNDNLTIYYTSASTWGGNIRSSNNVTNFMSTTIKSGTFGQATSESASGVYVGGLNGGNIYAPSSLTVEGGDILYLNGGPLVDSSMANWNAIYINFKGGVADYIFGGAARSLTHGNRIINMSGGNVNFSVFGGSNGYNGDDNSDTNRGTLNGSSLIYIGGKAKVLGNANAPFGAESGSVFGAGNGNANSTQIGSVNNSTIVIGETASIKNNIYGGGNYGAVSSQSGNSSSSKINVIGGEIGGSIYGGGNNNGSGSTSVNTSITIEVSKGTINKSIYGGSRTKGRVYGSTNVAIHGGTVKQDVYGGGEGGYSSDTNYGTYVRDNVNVLVDGGEINGSVYGGSAYGTVNAIDQNTNSSTATTNVTINGGVIHDSVFGGGKGSATYTPKVVGDITVTVNNGSSGKVFGGFDASGKPSAGDVVYLNGGTVGSAFGGGNNANQDTTDIRLQGSTVTGNLYGGSNLLGTVTTSNVTVSSGKVTDIYGGNNMDGLTITTNVNVTGGLIIGDIYGGGNEASSTTSNVTISGASVNDVYGGGKKAGLTTSHVTVENAATTKKVFGGSNVEGDVSVSNVTVTGSTSTSVYGGNNQGGTTATTNVDTTSSTITNVFGGGDNAASTESNVTIHSGIITNVFGGGNDAGLTTSNVTVLDGTITNVFGGSNNSGNITTSNVIVGGSDESTGPVTVDVQYTKRAPGYYPQSSKPTYAEITVTVTNNTTQAIQDWSIALNVPNAEIFANDSNSNISVSGDTYTINSVNRYYGYNTLQPNGSYSFTFSVLSDTPLNDFDVTGSVLSPLPEASSSGNIQITNLYGGNNLGGVTTSANITATEGTIHTIYGGGNEASVGATNLSLTNINSDDIYGGGNAAGVTGNTYLDINDSVVTNNIYGGGNEGIVEGSTDVYLTDSHIQGNAFAGGNGSTAIVYGNSTITIDGTTEIGLDTSEAPNEGCVFGSGNAASTGLETVKNSVATVNLVGGTVHGNVYGGPKMAIVYGTTDTNIGTAAVSKTGLKEDNIHIYGTVFGGGESNASGSENYDWNFVSVTNGITLNIDGTDYDTNNHTFIINGSIFGSGNASTSSGESKIYIKNLGSRATPNRAISIQRTNYLEIESSVIELMGATDRTNDNATILYAFNMIDKMVIKNGTTLFLQHNANVLKELYSGVDVNGTLVPATVTINDDTKTVTKNVDNRIYMIPGQNLNVTTNQAASAYGKITGMTFFGMYNSYNNGTYRLGLYDPSLDYGDEGNASLEIVGGSYVLGLKQVNHDITKDGFYSNYIDEETNENIKTAYIDPTPVGDLGYRWILGFDAISYEFELFASRYSSLGTYELQMIHFADGDTRFTVLGFDSSGLNPEISLVDSTEVPRIGTTEAEANNILGLSLKAETQEWTGYGTTKLLSRNNGDFTGTREYLTDSRKLPPSLMIYLYHTKNISRVGNMGTVVVTLQAAIPKNAIDYDIKFVTITMHLLAVHVDTDSYDASITYDKKYEFTSATSVNITNQSQFTTYFSLTTFNDDVTKIYGNNNEYFHVLVSNNALPVNTMITMLDYGIDPTHPRYYYYRVTQNDYNDAVNQINLYHEATYRLSKFISMDSTSNGNTYNDAASNLHYYDASAHFVDEEFIFIFDFKDCTQVTGNHLNNTILFELRTSEDRTKFNVYGLREALMVYNTYESSNVVLDHTFTGVDSYLYYDIPDEFSYSTLVHYDETDNRESVIDTNYESSKMGLNVTFFDKDGEQVSSSLLVGTSIKVGNQQYFADADGVFRIRLANKVSNLNRECSIVVNKDLPAGEYTVRYSLFASDDGLHNSSADATVEEFTVMVVSSDNSIIVDCNDDTKLVFGETSLNHGGSSSNYYTVRYQAALNNPNFRVEVYKRKTSTIDTTEFESVPFNSLFKNVLTPVSGNEVLIQMNNAEQQFNFIIQDNLVSGTYKVVFKLYDNNQLIDDDEKYVIVQKKLE